MGVFYSLNYMMADKLIITNDAIDVPDSRDYPFEEFLAFKEFAQGNPIPIWMEDVVKIQNQWSVWACTRFWMTHISNGYNCYERQQNGKVYDQLDAMTEWEKWDKVLTLQNALKQFKKEWLIDGYCSIKNSYPTDKMIEMVDIAIDIWKLIYTWSLKWDRSKIGRYLEYVDRTDSKVNWHAFGLVKSVIFKGKKMYKLPNSWGDKWWDEWYFYLDPEDLPLLYTKYVVLDKDDREVFKYFEALQYAKQIVKDCKKLYWTNPPSEVAMKIHEMADFLRQFYKFSDSEL